MLLYLRRHKYVTVTTVMPYWFQVTSSECHSVKVLSTTVGFSLVVRVTDLLCHYTYNSRGAWHTPYAMLLSNYRRDATLNSYSGKVLFSQTYNSFASNLILVQHAFPHCYLSCGLFEHSPAITFYIQSNFNGSNTFGTMKICSRQV